MFSRMITIDKTLKKLISNRVASVMVTDFKLKCNGYATHLISIQKTTYYY
jgi:hypothetical protein